MTSTAQNRKRRIRINLAAIRTRYKMLIHWWFPTRKHTLAPALTHTIILALPLTGLTGRILLNDVLPLSNQVRSPPVPRLTFLLYIPLARYFRTEIGHGVISRCSSGSRWYWGRYCCRLCWWCSKRTQDLASHSASPPSAPVAVAMTKSLSPPAEVDVAVATPRVLHTDTFASSSLAASPAKTTAIPTSVSTRPRRATANYTMTYFSTEVPSQRNTQQERETRDGRRRDLIAPRQDVVEEDSASESGECESENDCVRVVGACVF